MASVPPSRMRSTWAPASSRERLTFSGTGWPKMSAPAQGQDVHPCSGWQAPEKSGVRIHGMARSWSRDEDRADGLPPLQRTEGGGDVGERIDVGGQRLGADRARGGPRAQ